MADMKNREQQQNNTWNETTGTGTPAGAAGQTSTNTSPNTGTNSSTQSGANSTPGSQNPYGYQNGYYRNTTPHQDEPAGRVNTGSSYHSNSNPYTTSGSSSYGSGNAGNTSSSGSTSSTGSGYTYVNYYSDPNGNVPGDKQKKPKKHGFLKVVAFVCAMVIVSGASIGIYDAVRSTNETGSGNALVAQDHASDNGEDASGESASSNSNTYSGGESWIRLAAGKDSMSVTEIVEKVTPSVVGVQATFTTTSGSNNNMYGYGNFFGFGGQNDSSQEVTGIGTGIIMSEDGYIITNAHVIYDDQYGYGEATAVQIQMSDQETTYTARIVAYDQEADIAVLKVDASGLTAAEFGDSSTCKVGEMVVAIGNPLGLEFQNTVTCGIISALNREVTINDNAMTLIQTDTAINSGNSGGPLINSAGQVIGINSAKMSSTYSGEASIEGIGFAIPMSEAQTIIDDLINYGYVTGRPQLGITCQDVGETVSQAYNLPIGAYVVSVTEGGSADAAGLQSGDVIVAIQGQEISTTEELNDIKNEYKAGDTITLTIVRSGERMEVEVTLAEVQATSEQ